MGCEALTLRSARQRRGLIETAAHEPYVNFEARPSGCIAERWPTRLNWCLTPVIADIALAGNSVSDTFAARRSRQLLGSYGLGRVAEHAGRAEGAAVPRCGHVLARKGGELQVPPF